MGILVARSEFSLALPGSIQDPFGRNDVRYKTGVLALQHVPSGYEHPAFDYTIRYQVIVIVSWMSSVPKERRSSADCHWITVFPYRSPSN